MFALLDVIFIALIVGLWVLTTSVASDSAYGIDALIVWVQVIIALVTSFGNPIAVVIPQYLRLGERELIMLNTWELSL